MNWFDCLITFDKVAKNRSFSQAARVLQLPVSVVTKQIQWLEKQLAMTLFIRTTRTIFITDSGNYLLEKIQELLETWQDLQGQLQNYKAEPEGTLSICLLPNLSGLTFFVDYFQQFIVRYPKIKLFITSTAKPISLTQDKVDLLIGTERYALEPENTVKTKLFDFSFQCYASPAYLKKHGTPKKLDDLAKHNCLTFCYKNYWEINNTKIIVSSNWQADSGDCLIKACLKNMGIIYQPDFLVQKEVEQKLLQKILVQYAYKKEPMYIFHTHKKYKSLKTALLIEELKKYSASFALGD